MKVDIKKTFVWLSFCLSLYIFGVAAYIEILNYRAGNFLPRTDEYYNNEPERGLVKWRYNITSDLVGLEQALSRYSNEYKELNNDWEPNLIVESQLLTENQTAWLIQAKRENMLHDAVVRFGLLQYPLLFVSFVCLFAAMAIVPKNHLYLIGICFLLNILSVISLIGRNYFGSLGW
jgi:hypothetical protein